MDLFIGVDSDTSLRFYPNKQRRGHTSTSDLFRSQLRQHRLLIRAAYRQPRGANLHLIGGEGSDVGGGDEEGAMDTDKAVRPEFVGEGADGLLAD